jgi:hypothetical protein
MPRIFGKSRAAAALVLGLALFAGAGCVTTLPSGFTIKQLEPAPEPVTKVYALWENRVRVALDPLNNGAPYPGLAAQVYFIGHDEAHPIHARGQLIFDLYDVTGAPEKPAEMVHRTVIDPDTLRKLRKRCYVGDGHVVFVDWPTYRPEITKVRVHLSFVPENGTPIYADPTVISLHGDVSMRIQSRQVIPAAAKQGS